MAVIDHLVYGVPDLAAARDAFERDVGVRPAIGGQHTGFGTWNALVSFGNCYLELIAPDPAQPPPDGDRPFGLDELDTPRLVTFAVRSTDGETLHDLIAALRGAGHDPGEPVAMGRETPSGERLEWSLTFPTGDHDGAVPFLIDWGTTPQPRATAPSGVDLVELVVEHPEPGAIESLWAAVGLSGVGLQAAPQPGLRAAVRGPSGELRL